MAELLVILSITAMVLGIGINSFISMEKRHLGKLTVDLRNELRAMQRLSMSEGRQYRLRFMNESLYEISYFDSVRNSYIRISSVDFPEGITLKYINRDDSIIVYTKRGTLSGNACSIILESENYSVALTLNVGVGRVSIKEILSIDNAYTPESLDEIY